MQLTRLNDAAIALHRVLASANVKHGIFGGYAVAALGGPRDSKDIDCLASVSKAQIVQLLNGRDGFTMLDSARNDYVAFFWSEKAKDPHAVLVEIFTESFPGATFDMHSVTPIGKPVQGAVFPSGQISLLDPAHIFKGKLRAAATRDKFHDSADLRWLETHFSAQVCAKRAEYSLEYVGLALKRYSELEFLFTRVGVDVQGAKGLVANVDIDRLPRPAVGDVQRGLLALP